MGKLPKGWIETTLGEMAVIVLGQSPPSSTYNDSGEGLPFYQGKKEFGALYPTPVKWCSSPNKIAEQGDVLISVRAPVGPTNICPERSCIGRGLAAIRGIAGIDTLFILYLLRSHENYISGKGQGTTFKAVTGPWLRGYRISLFPLSEQKRIVVKIEELFTKLGAGVEALQKLKGQLKRYRQSVLKAAFEGKLTEEWREAHKDELEPASVLLERIKKERRKKWEEAEWARIIERAKKEAQKAGKDPETDYKRYLPKDDNWKKKYKEPETADTENLPELPEGWSWTLSDAVFWFVTSGSRGWAKYYSDSGPLFLRMGNLDHASIKLDLNDIQKVCLPLSVEGTRTHIAAGDILVSITADVGMVAVAPESLGEAYINQHVALARAVPSMCREYVAWFLASEHGGQGQFRGLQRGATKIGLGLDDIRSVNIPLPSFAEQHEISKVIDRCFSIADKIEKAIEQSLSQSERLRQSILKKAFEGRLVPQDPEDEPAEKLLERIRTEKAKLEASKKKKRGKKRKSK